MASKIVSKVKKAVTNYGKNVAGGAGIVAGAVKNAVSTAGKSSQGASAMTFKVGAGMTPAQTAKAVAITTPNRQVTSGGLTTSAKNAQTVQKSIAGLSSSPVNINKAVSSGGIKNNSTGLIDSTGNPIYLNTYSSPVNTSYLDSSFPTLKTSALNGGISGSVAGGSSITGLGSSGGGGGLINTPYRSTSTIAMNDLSNKQIDIPTYTPADINAEGINAGAEGTFESYVAKIQAENEAMAVQKDSAYQKLLDQLSSPEENLSSAMKTSGYTEAQRVANEESAKLAEIIQRGRANQLKVIGQGRGIPEAILGGQQAQFARETAIEAMPVQASLEAAQGNLAAATATLDRLFNAKQADATNRLNYGMKMLDNLYDTADKNQKLGFDMVKEKYQRQYAEGLALEKDKTDYAKMAFANGQATLGSKIAKLDYRSPTFKEDLSKLQSQLRDPVQTAQLAKLNAEIAQLENKGQTINGENADLNAYASQYADTGKLPSPAELKLSGLSVGQVTTYAKQIPQSKGAVVSNKTGTKSNSISAEAEKDFQKLYNVVDMTKRLKELDKKRVGGLISGTLGKVFGSEDQGEYLTLRKAIVDEMSRMQSGAALTPDEIAAYNDYLPSRFSETLGLGQDSYKKITNFETAMNQKLENRLANNSLSIYGYSTVNVGNKPRVVGEIIDVGGVNYRVLPDGTLTDIL